MQQGSSVLLGQETIPGHIGSNTICSLGTAQEPGQDSAWRPRMSFPALDTAMWDVEGTVLLQSVPCGFSESFPLGQSALPQPCDFAVLSQTGGQHSR